MGYDYGQPTDGKNSFLFYLTDKGLVTYAIGSNKERTEMIYSTSSGNIRACGSTNSYARNANCSALIEHDGWRISEDYPFSF